MPPPISTVGMMYNATPNMRPMLRAAATSCSLMMVGDSLCQGIQRRRQTVKSGHDWARTARFGLVGFTLHGPFFKWAYSWLDRSFGAQATLQKAVIKTAVGQVTVFPVYLSALLVYMNALENRSFKGAEQKLRNSFLPIYTSGWIFWPVANIFNFIFIPPHLRLPYVNCCGIVWNTYLSFASNDEPPKTSTL